MKKRLLLSLVGLAAFSLTPSMFALSHEAREQAIADSGKPVAVSGGVKFKVPLAYDEVFVAVVTVLKKADANIALADKDTGVIATEIVITGGWKQTGTRTVVSLIRDTPTQTIVKVCVTTQKRYKAIQTEPWSDPVLDKAQTGPAAAAIKTVVGGQ